MSGPGDLHIRAARETDLVEIAAIYGAAVLEGTGTFETAPPSADEMAARWTRVVAAGCPYLVAVSPEGRVVGFAYAAPYHQRPAYRSTLEDSIYLAEAARGRGAGRALLGQVLQQAEQAGFRQVLAVIGDAANAGSIALHAACGFVHVGVLRDVGYKFGRWLDVVVMQRALGDGAATAPGKGRADG